MFLCACAFGRLAASHLVLALVSRIPDRAVPTSGADDWLCFAGWRCRLGFVFFDLQVGMELVSPSGAAPSCLKPSPQRSAVEDWLCFVISLCERLGFFRNTLTAGSNAFVFFGGSPQWVRFFEWPGSGAEAFFVLGGENRRDAALMQDSFCRTALLAWVRFFDLQVGMELESPSGAAPSCLTPRSTVEDSLCLSLPSERRNPIARAGFRPSRGSLLEFSTASTAYAPHLRPASYLGHGIAPAARRKPLAYSGKR